MADRRERRPNRGPSFLLRAMMAPAGIALVAILFAQVIVPLPAPGPLPGGPSPGPLESVRPDFPTALPLATTSPAVVTAGAEALAAARLLERNGDFAHAVAAYDGVRRQFPAAPSGAEAAFRLAHVFLEERDFAAVSDALRDFITSYPGDERVQAAWFLLGTAYEVLGERNRMREAIASSVKLAGPLAPYAALRLAGLHLENGDYSSVVASLQEVDHEGLPPGTRVELLERLGRGYEGSGAYAAAMGHYEKARGLADSDVRRASLTYRIAAAAARAGDLARASREGETVITEYADSPAARAAIELIDGLAPGLVLPFHRGLVLYYAGEHGAALESFAEQIALAPQSTLAAESRYFAARTHQARGDCDAAIAVFDRLFATYPDSPRLPQGRLERARCFVRLDRGDDALEALGQVAAYHPGSAAAANALWESARLLDEAGDWRAAAARYDSFSTLHPEDERAPQALFREGFLRWRLDEDWRALRTWERLATAGAPPEFRAKAFYWSGKTLLGLDDTAEARRHLALAAATKSDDYHAARARALAAQYLQPALDPPAPPPADPQGKVVELEQWTAAVAGRPADSPAVSLDDVLGRLRADAAFRRGEQLLAAGQRQQALREFEHAGKPHADDPLWQVRYALYAGENDLHGAAVRAAQRAMELARLTSVFEAPRALQRLIYPVPYEDLVIEEGKKYGLDPALLFALIRQESMFDRRAVSSAQARGLTQVMPATARDIATALGRDDFQLDDLFKPRHSIAFGALYLRVQLDNFGGDTARALAAYNGGGSNARRWATNDPDAYLENIDFAETRTYVRLVSAYHAAYREIYGR